MDSEEKVIFFIAGMIRVVFLPFVPNKGGGSSPVVAIGNICGGDICKKLDDPVIDGFLADHPEMMSEAVVGSEIIFRIVFLHIFFDDVINFLYRRE